MKPLSLLLALLVIPAVACSTSAELSANPMPLTTTAVFVPLATEMPLIPPTPALAVLCVTAEKALWLRSQPWETSKPVIPNALLAGTRLQVYSAPFAQRWVQVIVPELGVSGWVNSRYIGDCQ